MTALTGGSYRREMWQIISNVPIHQVGRWRSIGDAHREPIRVAGRHTYGFSHPLPDAQTGPRRDGSIEQVIDANPGRPVVDVPFDAGEFLLEQGQPVELAFFS